MDFKIGDILVFKDEDNFTYTDCVCEINKQIMWAGTENDDDVFRIDIKCWHYELSLYTDNDELEIYTRNGFYARSVQDELIEIWRKTDENTYERIWY